MKLTTKQLNEKILCIVFEKNGVNLKIPLNFPINEIITTNGKSFYGYTFENLKFEDLIK